MRISMNAGVRRLVFCVATFCGVCLVALGAGVTPVRVPVPVRISPSANQEAKRSWGPEQATGAPDTHQAGDIQTAWASLDPNGGAEWLRVDFEKATDVAEVRIRETYNPGAVSKVVAILESGAEHVLWEGQEPTFEAPAYFTVVVKGKVVSKSIKIYLDTTRKQGWNEIDAVELVGKDATRQWASHASASSTYAVKTSPTPVKTTHSRRDPGEVWSARYSSSSAWDPFATVYQKRVIVHLEGGFSVEGTPVQITGSFMLMTLPERQKTMVVNVQKIIYLETVKPASEDILSPGPATIKVNR